MTCPSIILEPLNMPAPSNLADVPLPTSLLAPQAALSIAVRTCLLEGPAFDGDGNLFFSDIIGNQIYRTDSRRCPVDLSEPTAAGPMGILSTLTGC